MTELDKLRQEVHSSRKAECDFIHKHSVPDEEDPNLFIFTITEEIIPTLKVLNKSRLDAEEALKNYVQNNPSYNILIQ